MPTTIHMIMHTIILTESRVVSGELVPDLV